MTTRRPLAAFVALAAGVAVVATAPAAAASPDGTQCGKRGGAKICQKPGHSSVYSEPPPAVGAPKIGALFQPGWVPGFGRAPGVAPVRD